MTPYCGCKRETCYDLAKSEWEARLNGLGEPGESKKTHMPYGVKLTEQFFSALTREFTQTHRVVSERLTRNERGKEIKAHTVKP
jgi:hypothetical protein